MFDKFIILVFLRYIYYCIPGLGGSSFQDFIHRNQIEAVLEDGGWFAALDKQGIAYSEV